MKFSILIFGLLSVVIISFNSCSKCGSGSGMPGPTQNINKGALQFSDSSRYWIDSLNQPLVFVGDSSKKIIFGINGIKNSTSTQDIGGSYFISDGECGGHQDQDYFTYPIQDYVFKSNTVSLTIRRTKYYWDLYSLYNNPGNKDKTQDGLEVNLNDYNFSIYPKDKWVTARYKSYDTISLGNRVYSNVIYTYYDTTGLSHLSPETHPYGVYYIIPKGVIGFEFSNGERYFAQ